MPPVVDKFESTFTVSFIASCRTFVRYPSLVIKGSAEQFQLTSYSQSKFEIIFLKLFIMSSCVNSLENLKLKRVVMEVFGGCNYTCQMCPQTNPGRGKSFTRKMSINEFKRILNDIVPKYGSPQINLEGSGEPTMAKDLPEYIKAVKEKTFWGFFFIFCFTAVGIFGISLHVVAYLVYVGLSEVQAAFSFGIAGMLNFVGMVLTGLAADKWPRHIVASVSYLLSFIAIFSLALMQLYPSIIFLIIFILGFGLSAGARGPIITTLMAEIFAGKGLASIYGATNLGQGLGAAAGALLAGFLFDLTGGYNFGFLICTIFTFLGAVLFWTVPQIRHAKI